MRYPAGAVVWGRPASAVDPAMVNTVCCAVCGTSPYKHKELKFHQFPRDERTHLWVEACKREDLKQKELYQLKYMHICSLHFEPHMYGKRLLKKSAVPTLNLPSVSNTQVNDNFSQTEDCEPEFSQVFRDQDALRVGLVNSGSPGIGVQTDEALFQAETDLDVQNDELQNPGVSCFGMTQAESQDLDVQSNIIVKLETECLGEESDELTTGFVNSSDLGMQSDELVNPATEGLIDQSDILVKLELECLGVKSDELLNTEFTDLRGHSNELEYFKSQGLDVKSDTFIKIEPERFDGQRDELLKSEFSDLVEQSDELVYLETQGLDVKSESFFKIEPECLGGQRDELLKSELSDLNVQSVKSPNHESTKIDVPAKEVQKLQF